MGNGYICTVDSAQETIWFKRVQDVTNIGCKNDVYRWKTTYWMGHMRPDPEDLALPGAPTALSIRICLKDVALYRVDRYYIRLIVDTGSIHILTPTP
jgi:hypothetical protein